MSDQVAAELQAGLAGQATAVEQAIVDGGQLGDRAGDEPGRHAAAGVDDCEPEAQPHELIIGSQRWASTATSGLAWLPRY